MIQIQLSDKLIAAKKLFVYFETSSLIFEGSLISGLYSFE